MNCEAFKNFNEWEIKKMLCNEKIRIKQIYYWWFLFLQIKHDNYLQDDIKKGVCKGIWKKALQRPGFFA